MKFVQKCVTSVYQMNFNICLVIAIWSLPDQCTIHCSAEHITFFRKTLSLVSIHLQIRVILLGIRC